MTKLEMLNRAIAALKVSIDDHQYRIDELREELEPMLEELLNLEEQRDDAEDAEFDESTGVAALV